MPTKRREEVKAAVCYEFGKPKENHDLGTATGEMEVIGVSKY